MILSMLKKTLILKSIHNDTELIIKTMSRLARNKKLIKTLSVLPRKQRNRLLKKIDKSCIDCIRDCCKSILKGKIPLKPGHKRRLRPYKSKLRAAANPSLSSSAVRKHLQFGGFFQALIPALAGLIGPIVSNLL